MVWFQKYFLCGLCMMLMIGIIPFQAMADESAETKTAVKPLGDALLSPSVLSELSGFTSDGTDPEIFCFDATPQGTFNQGDLVWFNVFWSDTAEEDLKNNYWVRVDVEAPDGSSLIHLRHLARFKPRGVDPGAPIDLCFGFRITLAADAPQGTFPWRTKVTKFEDQTVIQGQLNDITIIPSVKQVSMR
jgi:hypothetical protein